MAEKPTAKPTDSFDWPASTHGVSEPSSLKRNAGWGYAESPPETEFNWWWKKEGALLDWLRSLAVRRFENLHEAITATEQFDTFLLQSDTGVGITQAHQTRTTEATAITCVCTDGLHIYYVDDQYVRAQPDRISGSAAAAWEYDASAYDTIDCIRIDTDGHIVAIASGITGTPPNMVFVSAEDGSYLASSGATGYVYGCACDSFGVTPRVWWGTAAGGAADKIRCWQGGAISDSVTGLPVVRAICAFGDFVAWGDEDGSTANCRVYKKTGGSALSLHWKNEGIGISLGNRSQGICSDGELVFFAIDGTGGAVPTYRAFYLGTAAAAWTTSGPANHAFGSALRVECDDRYVYARWYHGTNGDGVAIIDKRTGVLLYHIPVSGIVDFCVDGQHIIVARGDGDLRYYSTQRQPQQWVRRAPTEQGRLPARRLALPHGGR